MTARAGTPAPAPGCRRRRWIPLTVVTLLFVAVDVGLPWYTGRQADREQAALDEALRATYAGTTSADIDGLWIESFSPGDAGRFDDFTRAPRGSVG